MNDIDARLRALRGTDPSSASRPPVEELVGRLRRRRVRMAVAAGAAVVVLAAGLSAAALGGGDENTLRTADEPDETTTTTGEATTTTTATMPPPSTTGPTTPAVVATTSTTVCRNSHNPACGPFRWDPAPGPDRTVILHTEIRPEQPKAGEEVTFRLVIQDPDALVSNDDVALSYGDGSPTVNGRSDLGEGCPSYRTRYGPWTPPPASGGRIEVFFTHVYEAEGNYSWGYTVYSSRCDQWGPGVPRGDSAPNQAYNPYASYGSDIGTLAVAPAPSD